MAHVKKVAKGEDDEAKLEHKLGDGYGAFGAYTPAGVESVGRTEDGSEEAVARWCAGSRRALLRRRAVRGDLRLGTLDIIAGPGWSEDLKAAARAAAKAAAQRDDDKADDSDDSDDDDSDAESDSSEDHSSDSDIGYVDGQRPGDQMRERRRRRRIRRRLDAHAAVARGALPRRAIRWALERRRDHRHTLCSYSLVVCRETARS